MMLGVWHKSHQGLFKSVSISSILSRVRINRKKERGPQREYQKELISQRESIFRNIESRSLFPSSVCPARSSLCSHQGTIETITLSSLIQLTHQVIFFLWTLQHYNQVRFWDPLIPLQKLSDDVGCVLYGTLQQPDSATSPGLALFHVWTDLLIVQHSLIFNLWEYQPRRDI